MGVLDDAIREHLELMRRRGADAEDVARYEEEALGPALRRNSSEGGAAIAPALDNSDVDDADLVGEPAPEVEAVEPEPEPEPQPEIPEVEDDDLFGEPEPEVEAGEPDMAADEPGPAPDLNSHPVGSQPTVQFSSDDVAEATGRSRPRRSAPVENGDEHDELEDTPEFLQEAPEHDKLWFEQKPPKEFDF